MIKNTYIKSINKFIDGNASKPHISKMHDDQEKTVSKQTGDGEFATSIFAILVDFELEFWYKPLTLL